MTPKEILYGDSNIFSVSQKIPDYLEAKEDITVTLFHLAMQGIL